MKTLLHLFIAAERGGCETTGIALIRGLDDWKHSVLVFSPPGPMSLDFANTGAEVRHLGLVRPRFKRVISEVLNVVSSTKPDGVILWHGMVFLPEILRALRDFPGPILAYGGNPAHRMPRSIDWYFVLRGLIHGRRARATYVCCSQHVADSFDRSTYLRGFPRAVIPNGVRELSFPVHRPREIPPSERFTIGMVARLDPIKDYDTLLRAFAIVLEQRPLARLEIAGDGVLRRELEALARDLKLGASVAFLGMVPDAYQVMSTWDLFVYATTDQEGLGSALAEAMMIGLPCVVTDVGPMREVTGDPPTALMASPQDPAALAQAIVALVGDSEERRRLGNSARVRALNEFDAGVSARRYGRLLNGDRGGT